MLDHLLAFLLLVVVPGRALWRTKASTATSKSKAERYVATIYLVSGLLLILTVNWLVTGRAASALGLQAPATIRALVGLGLATMIIVILGLVICLKRGASTTEAELDRRELLPETPSEVRLFILFSVVVGFGWEILYRGYLVQYLQPQIDLWSAVIIAALAYGLAHGFKTLRQTAASITAALVFTIAYVLTWNLWWLMVLHAGLPLLSLFADSKRVVPPAT